VQKTVNTVEEKKADITEYASSVMNVEHFTTALSKLHWLLKTEVGDYPIVYNKKQSEVIHLQTELTEVPIYVC
jgi:hypothetical protein